MVVTFIVKQCHLDVKTSQYKRYKDDIVDVFEKGNRVRWVKEKRSNTYIKTSGKPTWKG